MINEKSFYIVVQFSHPELVSQTNNGRDKVQVIVKHAQSFYSSNGKTATTPFDKNVSNVHPQRNLPFVETELIGDLASGLGFSLKAFLAGNTAISILGAVAFQHMWGMINALQIIVLGALFATL